MTVAERVSQAGAAASIEEARIIVSGGRGVGGPDGFAIVQALADALGGAVGATRAAVDAGWIPYSHQIGQTGKIVKPALYLALGISGAIQHKVGMQTAETIVAVNRDPDAPIADFADLFVVGDLFEVAPAILAALADPARGRTETAMPAWLSLALPIAAFVAPRRGLRDHPAPDRPDRGPDPRDRPVPARRSRTLSSRIDTSLGGVIDRIDARPAPPGPARLDR